MSPSNKYTGLRIALASFLGLFIELMIIRIHSSYFQLFAYFKNISLLSCFLGLGIGFARGQKRPKALPLVIPLFGFQILFMYMMRFSPISAILQNPISEQLGMGLTQTTDTSQQLVVYTFLILVFSYNALCFVPLGQLISFLMSKQNKLISYSWNLLGSLIGIILFTALSFLWSPPLVWFITAALLVMIFFRKEMNNYLIGVITIVILIVFLGSPNQLNKYDIYTPYQLITLSIQKDKPLELETSNSYYQKILDLSPKNIANNEMLKHWEEYYSLPFNIKQKADNVLIVGSGTGNDVAAAVRHGVAEIDAVEIDPAIVKVGRELHPESPYLKPQVNTVIDDARTFIRYTRKKYDLIIFGLLDSHTLLSGRSGVRLDSYIYTVEAFREARLKLKKGGIMSLTFALLRPDMGRKLFVMLEEAFDGQKPIVYYSSYDGGFTFLTGEGTKNIDRQKINFAKVDFFEDSRIAIDKSTDDWPFFYMANRKYPVSYVTLLLILFIISLGLVRKLVGGRTSGFSIPLFLLGAGFMQLETKAITELALVYGSTWLVTSIVIIFILIMGFLANFMVMKNLKIPYFVVYSLLALSILLGFGITYINFFAFSSWFSRVISAVVLTLPLFFSGLAFSYELKRSSSIATALYSNLLGAMFGGFLEYNSMYFGYRALYLLALVIYVAAFLSSTMKQIHLKQLP